MTRKKKEEVLEELVLKFTTTNCFYVVNAEGLDAKEIDDFRKRCFKAGVGYQVVKNTLIRKAFEKLKNEVDYTSFGDAVLKGFSGILFSKRDAESLPARLIQDFKKQKKSINLFLKGAFINDELFVGEEHLDVLGKLKSKNELIGELIELLKSPFARVISSLQSGQFQIAGIIRALAEKKS